VPPPVLHAALLVHVRTHTPAELQARVPESPQSALVAHCTQVPADEQMGRVPPPAPMQFVVERHWTQTLAVPQ
jgi:hypothetical protein